MPSQEVFDVLGWLSKVVEGDEQDRREIWAGTDILIGRDTDACQIIRETPSISNVHVKIYSIFGEHNAFVYAEDLSTNGTFWRYQGKARWLESRIGKNKAVLLSDGDQIRLCDGSCYVFNAVAASTRTEFMEDANLVQRKEIESFMNLYQITDRQLGAGSYGRVHLAIDQFRQRQMACKMVALKDESQPWGAGKKFANVLWREVNLLKEISHPNIIHVERVFYTECNLYIIEDLITGGDLMSLIEHRGPGAVIDTEACFVIYQILKALEYLHGRGIVHRDIKPDNILISRKEPMSRIILTDFGHSIDLGRSRSAPSKRMKTFCGTLDFVAPEVHAVNPMVTKMGYTMAADLWSVGAVTTALFFGHSIFADRQDPAFQRHASAAILNAIGKCDLSGLDQNPLWQEVDTDARNLIKKLLVLNETVRLDVGQALKQSWFTRGDHKEYLERNHQRVIKGWMPSTAAIDFSEDLDLFVAARKPRTDASLMPPPPKPSIVKKTAKDLALSPLKDTQRSPYFSVHARHDVVKHSFVNPDDHRPRQAIGKRTLLPSRKRKKRLHDLDFMENSGVGDSSPLTRKQLRTIPEQSSNENEESRNYFETPLNVKPRETSYRRGSGSEDDDKLHDKVSKERRDFISAKLFGQSVKSRRDLKA